MSLNQRSGWYAGALKRYERISLAGRDNGEDFYFSLWLFVGILLHHD
jgi:hypothetical protein